MNARELISDLKKNGFDLQQIKDALCDGDFLAKEGYNDQAVVEEAYEIVKSEMVISA